MNVEQQLRALDYQIKRAGKQVTSTADFSGGIRIGSALNGISMSGDGFTMDGFARVKKALFVNNRDFHLPVANPPTSALRSVGASGGVYTPVLQFSKTVQNNCYVQLHATADLDTSVNADLTIHWLPGAAHTTGNYVMKIEYLVYAVGENVTTGTPTTLTVDVTPTANLIQSSTFPTGVALDVNEIIMMHVYRDVASDNGDDTLDLLLLEFEYTANKLGAALI